MGGAEQTNTMIVVFYKKPKLYLQLTGIMLLIYLYFNLSLAKGYEGTGGKVMQSG